MKRFFYLYILRRQPKFGSRIFQPDSWLDKQVQEAMIKERIMRDLLR